MEEEVTTAAVESVHAWQRYYGMEPRSDSALTTQYAQGLVAMTPDQVARELVCTDYVFQHTLYGEVIEDFFRAVANELRRRTKLSWTATWPIVRFYGPIALKLMMVSATGIRIPLLR